MIIKFLKKNLTIIVFSILAIFAILMLLFFYEIKLQEKKVKIILQNESKRIEENLNNKIDHTSHIMLKIVKEIEKKPHDNNHIYNVINVYKANPDLVENFSWTFFSWADSHDKITVDAVYGILKESKDISNRDYIKLKLTKDNPEKILIGEPIFGAVSKIWMIPAGMGASSTDNKYLGTITIGFEIEALARLLQKNIENSNIEFEMLSAKKIPILSARYSSNRACKINGADLDKYSKIALEKLEDLHQEDFFYIDLIKKNKAIYAKKLEKYPFYFILKYDEKAIKKRILEPYLNKLKIILLILITIYTFCISYKTFKVLNETK